MKSWEELKDFVARDGFTCICHNVDTGELYESDNMRDIFRAIKSSRHWEYTCQFYPYPCTNDNTTLVLQYRIATRSGRYYLNWYNIKKGKIIDCWLIDVNRACSVKGLAPYVEIVRRG